MKIKFNQKQNLAIKLGELNELSIKQFVEILNSNEEFKNTYKRRFFEFKELIKSQFNQIVLSGDYLNDLDVVIEFIEMEYCDMIEYDFGMDVEMYEYYLNIEK